MRSGNPTLNKKTFQNITRTGPIVKDDLMTISGTVDKTGICLAILLFAAYFTYGPNGTSYIFLGGFGGLAVVIATVFNKQWAPITAPLYAMLEGLFLGSISYMYGQMYEGIVFNAIILTVSILLSLLFAYKSGLIKATENFKLGVVAATGGIFLFYVFLDVVLFVLNTLH